MPIFIENIKTWQIQDVKLQINMACIFNFQSCGLDKCIYNKRKQTNYNRFIKVLYRRKRFSDLRVLYNCKSYYYNC